MPYKDIDIPAEKAPTEYSYMERRAELLQFILDAGHPDFINRTKFADYYGVAVSTITKDIQKLRVEIRDDLGTDADLITQAVFQKALKEEMKGENWMNAAELVSKWNEWLFETGHQERAATKLDATVRAAETETADYEIIPDDAEVTAMPAGAPAPAAADGEMDTEADR